MDFLETIHAGGKPLFVNGLNIRSKVSPGNFDVPSRNCSLSYSLTRQVPIGQTEGICGVIV